MDTKKHKLYKKINQKLKYSFGIGSFILYFSVVLILVYFVIIFNIFKPNATLDHIPKYFQNVDGKENDIIAREINLDYNTTDSKTNLKSYIANLNTETKEIEFPNIVNIDFKSIENKIKGTTDNLFIDHKSNDFSVKGDSFFKSPEEESDLYLLDAFGNFDANTIHTKKKCILNYGDANCVSKSADINFSIQRKIKLFDNCKCYAVNQQTKQHDSISANIIDLKDGDLITATATGNVVITKQDKKNTVKVKSDKIVSLIKNEKDTNSGPKTRINATSVANQKDLQSRIEYSFLSGNVSFDNQENKIKSNFGYYIPLLNNLILYDNVNIKNLEQESNLEADIIIFNTITENIDIYSFCNFNESVFDYIIKYLNKKKHFSFKNFFVKEIKECNLSGLNKKKQITIDLNH